MLKTVISVKGHIKIDLFPKVFAFLEDNFAGYKPTKSKVLSRDKINIFIANNGNETSLLINV